MLLSGKVFLFWVLVACSSCSYSYFANSRIHNDITYLGKPIEGDSARWGTYISGNIAISEGFNPKDVNLFQEINLHQSYTFNYGNIALGGFGYAGNYNFRSDPEDQTDFIQPFVGKYTYYGGGVRGSFNFTYPTYRADFRLLGIDAVWSKEWGNYLQFRHDVQDLPYVIAGTESELLTVAITSETCIKFRRHIQLAFKLYLGEVVKGQFQKIKDEYWFDFMGANVFFTYDSLFCYFQGNIIDNAGANFGIGYRLH